MAARKRKRRRMGTSLGKPTKKDFIAVAGILCAHGARGVADDMATYFKQQNPRFDRARFMQAAAGSRCIARRP